MELVPGNLDLSLVCACKKTEILKSVILIPLNYEMVTDFPG